MPNLDMEIVNHRVVSRAEGNHDQRSKKCKKEEGDLSDCESETSEVLSVGSEPTPGADGVGVEPHEYETARYMKNPLSRLEYQDDRRIGIISSRSPSPSPSNDSGSCNVAHSPASYCSPQQPPSSPTASSVRSPASSSATASSPGRSDTIQDGVVSSRYQPPHQCYPQHLLARFTRESDLADYPSGTKIPMNHELPYTSVDRLHRTPISLPLATRHSLSPPSSTTVNGLQATGPPTAFHSNCRDNSLLVHSAHLQVTTHQLIHQSSQLQHVPSTALIHHHHHQQQQHQHQLSHYNQPQSHKINQQVQHRLSVSKLIQNSPIRESSSPVSPIRDDSTIRNNVSPANNSLQINNNNSHHRNNNEDNNSNNNNNNNSNDNDNIQGNLKFSIDNILKADFGRRITDPISLKKSRPKKVVQRPIDLTKDFLDSSSESSDRGSESTSVTNPSPVTTSATPALNGTSTTTGSDTSKQMLWPAWVYCTRYSDRPSSGRSCVHVCLQVRERGG
ncbi:putative uncharacterized protein DDB_G0289263 isoform X2 [Fopius arisanus]|uniref:Uncharacterized protein n=1 Tax=Fopius arisanus TaxID=64838 RepID=A0A9R1T4Z1_9HYME|nr:PREDICTED: putative uncharacterized protein DDB_G0289263 isoform X2 [Fopius arisanus]